MTISNVYSVKDSSTVTPVTLRVDPQGYFLYWTDQNKVRFQFLLAHIFLSSHLFSQ